ncbi:bifunctional diaminohydroxyphosphoribosylaminopyrimidine deaminase/5-amino-6-(5-phosphoribosylamino)uracil reductase RibD [Salinisphaera sp. Q1T1-3]|uniref:bifunctional diaminohydroxyphosphoribosylaminopyrimidine deaminase/5-amino-6-(5-phosphoribosylamino)uracil reductase RibD n=1 Tax=Salinisphaera sp. Q1T1-3 TaxID=2321229 RepID=UPI000E71EE0C|nr:bifunctional diaminohydroxyphosphoribosylaminopyrimidine deaminase/5-amino-6-(5-phosphoribosylamino)uracil reductase RibD [Salinisphaera sp. Q1T1-3]RJS94745.1 bifunctional diaminohydroxyphosphoribosylaminopyrimidine deaminase/5-amino-6-(5-phosphoribosylamino)uracil reductase RibD [Salinisphaera sp. Q1T1-3]
MSGDDVRVRVHEMFMQRAIELARRGWYTTRPNPRVGCVIVSGNRVVRGEGWHERAGEAHAERRALDDLATRGHSAKGTTAYVTLEPCSHSGRTGPCTRALIESGVARVVVGAQDPNPVVDGRGIAALREAGIEVVTGVLAERCAALNRGFNQRMAHGRPRVRVKLAMSLDGRTAAADGSSQWISGTAAREDVHRLRAESGAVMIGRGTLAADDPSLTVRLDGDWMQPLRVVLDTRLSMSPQARMLEQSGETLVVTAADECEAADALEAAGARVLHAAGHDDGLDLARILSVLAEREINDVLVEAGPTLAGALARAGLVDEFVIYVAPMLIGDAGRGLMALSGAVGLDDAMHLVFDQVEPVGPDLRITARPASRN